MKNNNLVSLRWYRAKQLYDAYYAVPSSQRSNERAGKMIEAIFDYAYEHVPKSRRTRSVIKNISADQSRQISRRLEEFIMPGEQNPDSVMNWLHANMVQEAWAFPDDLQGFVHECLRDG
jgi:hypothetical protein